MNVFLHGFISSHRCVVWLVVGLGGLSFPAVAEDGVELIGKVELRDWNEPTRQPIAMGEPTYLKFKPMQLLDDEPIGFLSSSRDDFRRHSYSHHSLFGAALHQCNISLFLTDKKSSTSH